MEAKVSFWYPLFTQFAEITINFQDTTNEIKDEMAKRKSFHCPKILFYRAPQLMGAFENGDRHILLKIENP